ncbi:MAG: ABC transporter substrate-binding protein [Chloroflexi bacterium]|nr:ABC transporter substrate-binding protein [Chloroflexota bacterium]
MADEVVFVEEPDSAKAVRELEADNIQVYSGGLTDPELAQRIKTSSEMGYETSYGSSAELTFNPSGPIFKTGKLNPFSVAAVREAMNWLIDRHYVAEETYGGLAVPRYFTLNTAFPDYAKLASIARALEVQYAPNPAKAKEVITAEMKKLGAVLTNGKWYYQGKPVELNFIIRTEDKRKDVGDYVATLLENMGFTVNRQYKTAADASPIWIGSDPSEGRWNIYTGGWASTAISRDQASNFAFYYTPTGRPDPLWQAYKPSPEFEKVADTLVRRDYKTLDERQQLMTDALSLSMKDSVRVWLVDTLNISPHRADVAVAADLAGGISGSSLWPYTLRYTDKSGGSITIGSPSLLTEPWNPVAGSNWIYDTMIIRGTEDAVDLPDPYTGLILPNHVKSAEVYVQQGLPVSKTQDWLTLSFVPTIQAPQDAWINWDASAQRFRTVGEVHPGGLTARTKTVVHYADDLFQTRWHDGTKLTMADILLGLALGFDRPQEKSSIFDESEVPSFETFLKYFKGMKIIQENPLVAEVYSDQIFPDAEWIADSADGYFYTSVPWHVLSLGILAETNHELAFSSSKADQLKLEWMSYIAGPSLPILDKYRQQALKDKYIPYANFLGKYVTADEASKRYTALGDWYQKRGHFWVGNGPYYLDSVHTVQKTVVLHRFDQYRQTDQKLLAFTSPRIANVKISGPDQTRIGGAAEFQLEVTFNGKPYPIGDMDLVKFLLFGSNGALAISGDAEAVRDGLWRVRLTADQSKQLQAGANRLEIIAAPKVVSVASFSSFTFAMMP